MIHTGTTGPSLAREMEEALAARSVALIDAPVSGGPERAPRGDLVTMASGPEAALGVARPVIASYSGKIVDFGPKIGSAETMKLVKKGGLDSEKMLEVLSVGTGQNYAIASIIAQYVFSRSFEFRRRAQHSCQGLRLHRR